MSEIAADIAPGFRSSRTRPRQLLPGIDGRSVWTRRCRALITAHLADLGGVANCSTAERSIIRRAAVLTTELERMEHQFALDEQASPADLETYQRVANTLRRLLQTVGLERRAKPVESLGDMLRNDIESRRATGQPIEGVVLEEDPE